MAAIERRNTVSANYDPASARVIRDAAEQIKMEVAVEDKDGSQDEYEDNDSFGKSKDEDTGSCRLSSKLETRADGLIFDKELGVVCCV